MSHIFRAIWPIIDPQMGLRELADEAIGDVPGLALQARATITGRGQFRTGTAVPGSGGAAQVLIYEAPAKPAPHRAYWRAA